MTTSYALRIPRGLSLLVAHDPDAEVPGLEEFSRKNWPDVRLAYWSFDLMVVCGLVLLALSLAAGWLWWKQGRLPENRWFLYSLVLAGPLGFGAIEAG